jgi:hypothetical protein
MPDCRKFKEKAKNEGHQIDYNEINRTNSFSLQVISIVLVTLFTPIV